MFTYRTGYVLLAVPLLMTSCSTSDVTQNSPGIQQYEIPGAHPEAAPAALKPAVPPPPPTPMARMAVASGPHQDFSMPQPVFRDRYHHFDDNPVKLTANDSVSTISLDVDTGSYSNVRRFLNEGRLPPKDSVRVEELINYFSYEYPHASGSTPFSVSSELAPAPWNPEHLVLRVGVKAVERNTQQMPPANLVFLVDTSGSMFSQDKLPLVQSTLKLLVEQLRPQDRITLITYAGGTRVVLAGASGRQKDEITAAIARLQAGGSTAGGAAIELAYAEARAHFIDRGINRILLATDGDFNVGVIDTEQLKDMVARERAGGVSLTTLGFGRGNYNEAMMKQLAMVGNGNYSYIDSLTEAKKVLVEELSATFNSVAADVKMQLEFNPATVAEWRLIGYENRLLNEADFKNDKVDAVEIGAGKSVTVLYELTPVGKPTLHSERRYTVAPMIEGKAGELGELRIRYKKPGEERSLELTRVIPSAPSARPGPDWKFATAVAGFGQLLRGNVHIGDWSFDETIELAQNGIGKDTLGYRREFVRLVELARSLNPAPRKND